MGEGWRRKTYYEPRVLIRTAHILDCPFPDSLVCLTGAEQALLRNLTQYLHRRSTFASECHQNHYLAPSNEEWDALEAIVAELEDKLMGCTELTDLLTAIKAATECACQQLTAMPKEGWPAGGVLQEQPDYDNYTSPVYADEGDPPGDFPTWGDWHDYVCIAAQHVFHEQTDLMNRLEVWYSAGAAITFALFQTLVLGTAIVPPVALALTVISILAVAGTALSVIAVRDWIEEHMQELVCAVFLASTVHDALARIGVIVAETWNVLMNRAFFDGIVNRKLLSSIFDGTVPDYASWQGRYSPAYCSDCSEPPYYGDGWFAISLSPSFAFVLGHPPYPVNHTIYDLPLIATERRVALLWEIVEHVGANHVCCNTGPCGTPRVWNDGHVSRTSAGWQYSGPDNEIDEQAVLDALCPGALISQLNTYPTIGQGDVICGYWRLEWATQPDHYFKIRPAWMVYKETP